MDFCKIVQKQQIRGLFMYTLTSPSQIIVVIVLKNDFTIL